MADAVVARDAGHRPQRLGPLQAADVRLDVAGSGDLRAGDPLFGAAVLVGDPNPIDLLGALVGAQVFDFHLDVPVRAAARIPFAQAIWTDHDGNRFPRVGLVFAIDRMQHKLHRAAFLGDGAQGVAFHARVFGRGKRVGVRRWDRFRVRVGHELEKLIRTGQLRLGKAYDARRDMTLAAGHVAVDPQLVRGHLRGYGVAARAEAFRLTPLLQGAAADRRHRAEPAHGEERDTKAAPATRRAFVSRGDRADAPAGRPRGLARHGVRPARHGVRLAWNGVRPARRCIGLARHGVRLAWQAIRLIGSIRQRRLRSPRGLLRSSTG